MPFGVGKVKALQFALDAGTIRYNPAGECSKDGLIELLRLQTECFKPYYFLRTGKT